ncbi:MAG: hypothetical protein EXR72_24345 [Myxococcales bacterium]|nr:hypothetical protein [Myxococcales bacterium]
MPRRRQDGAVPAWGQLYELAAPQAGYFTLQQARQAGYSAPLIEYYVRTGRVERVGRGLFRLAHFPPGEHEDLVVIWLWSQRRGVFSHETALMLQDLSDVLPATKRLTVPSEWRKRRLRVPAGVLLHYGDLAEAEISWVGAIPITKPLRTIVDCATAGMTPDLLSQAIDQATRRGLVSRGEIKRAVAAARSTLESHGPSDR